MKSFRRFSGHAACVVCHLRVQRVGADTHRRRRKAANIASIAVRPDGTIQISRLKPDKELSDASLLLLLLLIVLLCRLAAAIQIYKPAAHVKRQDAV
jgi:hypothetical protein